MAVTCDWCYKPIFDDGDERDGMQLQLNRFNSLNLGRTPAGDDITLSFTYHAGDCTDAAIERIKSALRGGKYADLEAIPVLDGPPDGPVEVAPSERAQTKPVARLTAERQGRQAAGTSLVAELEPYTYWLLWHADIVTFEELAQRSEEELLAIRSIGPKRVAQIVRAMQAHGFSLRDARVA